MQFVVVGLGWFGCGGRCFRRFGFGLCCCSCLYCCWYRCFPFILRCSFSSKSFWSGEMAYSPFPFTLPSEIWKLPTFSGRSLELSVVNCFMSCLVWILEFRSLWSHSWINFFRVEKSFLKALGGLQGILIGFLAFLWSNDFPFEVNCSKTSKPFRRWDTEGISHTLCSLGWRDLSIPVFWL